MWKPVKGQKSLDTGYARAINSVGNTLQMEFWKPLPPFSAAHDEFVWNSPSMK